MRSDFCYFSDKRNHLVAQCIPRINCLRLACFTFSHLHSLPLMVKLYHTAALLKRRLPSNFIRQPAQLFADAFGLFLVTMHDRILKQSAWPTVARSAKEDRLSAASPLSLPHHFYSTNGVYLPRLLRHRHSHYSPNGVRPS